MFKFIADIQPSKNKMLLDLITFRKELSVDHRQLVPVIDEKELSLISLNEINFKKWGIISKVYKGAFTTIFHEEVFRYAIKDYFAARRRRIIYVRMAEHEIDYLSRGSITEVFIDRNHVGTLTEEASLYVKRKKNVVASIEQESSEYQGIIVGSREVAMLLNPDLTDKFNPRAFVLLKDIDRNETLALLAVSIYEMIKKIIINKKID